MTITVGGFDRLEDWEGTTWAICKTVYGGEYGFEVSPEEASDILDWATGRMPIQQALGYLGADYREVLLSGIPPGEWDDFIGVDFVDPPEEQFELDID